MTHIPDYKNALLDIVRILTPSGQVGLSFWKVNQNEYTETSSQIAPSFAGQDFFKDAAPAALPWEDWFTQPDHVQQGLKDAGLGSIAIEEERSTVLPRSMIIWLRDTSVFKHAFCVDALMISHGCDFSIQCEKHLHNRFADPLEFSPVVLFGLGRKTSK